MFSNLPSGRSLAEQLREEAFLDFQTVLPFYSTKLGVLRQPLKNKK